MGFAAGVISKLFFFPSLKHLPWLRPACVERLRAAGSAGLCLVGVASCSCWAQRTAGRSVGLSVGRTVFSLLMCVLLCSFPLQPIRKGEGERGWSESEQPCEMALTV